MYESYMYDGLVGCHVSDSAIFFLYDPSNLLWLSWFMITQIIK